MQLVVYSADHAHRGRLAGFINAWDLLWKRSGAKGKAKRNKAVVSDRILACADPGADHPAGDASSSSDTGAPTWILFTPTGKTLYLWTPGKLPSPQAVERIIKAAG